MTSSELVDFLRHTPVFSECSDQCLLELAGVCHLRKLGKGQILFLQLDAANNVYVVRTGAIFISITSEDGRELVLNEMRPGDLFGELAVLTEEPRSADALARVSSQVLVMPAEHFLMALDREPQLGRRLLKMMARRLRMSTDREGALAFLDAQARVARLLLQLNENAGDRGYVTITQSELAQRLGLARQTVAKILGKWRSTGWLITGRGRIMILRPEALAEIEQRFVT